MFFLALLRCNNLQIFAHTLPFRQQQRTGSGKAHTPLSPLILPLSVGSFDTFRSLFVLNQRTKPFRSCSFTLFHSHAQADLSRLSPSHFLH